MKKQTNYFITVYVIFLSIWTSAGQTESLDIKISDELKQNPLVYLGMELSGDWPPYEYYERKDGEKTSNVKGYNIDILNIIFSEYGLNYDIRFYPLKRCLKELGIGKKIHMMLPMSLNEERKKKYLVSDVVYSVRPAYAYVKNNFPEGLKINKAEELLKHGLVCGKLGYNYKNFGLPTDTIYKGAHDFYELGFMLKKKRCSILLARYEILSACHLIGKPCLSDEISLKLIPGVPEEGFHFLISKEYLNGEELLEIINKKIRMLRKNGKLKEILKRYATH